MKCKIQIQQKQATLKAKRLIQYQNCHLIEAHGRSGQTYYLIFHKARYINTLKIADLNPNSFIATAIKHGLIVTSPHHAIDSLIRDQIFPCLPLKKMIQTMSQNTKQLEQIIILSYFDHAITQEKIINLFIECFRQHRRDGQLQLAFQAISTLKHYQPDNQFAHDILATLTFQNYQLEQKEIFAYNPLDLDTLETIYSSDGHELERSILATTQLLNGFSDHYWQLFLSTLQPFPAKIRAKTMLELLRQQPNLIDSKAFSDTLLKSADSKSYLKTVLTEKFPHHVQAKPFLKHLAQVDQATHLLIFNQYQVNFIKRIDSFTLEEKEKATRIIIESAFKDHSIDQILDWLAQFNDRFSFTNQLEMIKQLEENPDQQAKLADIYQKFNYLSGAIDCLKWEIELDPTNETLFKKLIKLLKKTDQDEEADAYQEQRIHQMKYSN